MKHFQEWKRYLNLLSICILNFLFGKFKIKIGFWIKHLWLEIPIDSSFQIMVRFFVTEIAHAFQCKKKRRKLIAYACILDTKCKYALMVVIRIFDRKFSPLIFFFHSLFNFNFSAIFCVRICVCWTAENVHT